MKKCINQVYVRIHIYVLKQNETESKKNKTKIVTIFHNFIVSFK